MPLTQIKNSNLDSTNGLFFRNRLINGDMRIDQRNNGSSVSVTVGTSQLFPVDRWRCQNINGSTVYSAQRSNDAPAGFTNSLILTTTTAGAVGADDSKHIWQPIEGFNVADFGFGTSSAKTITLSFWVKSSLTGSFGGAISSDGALRSYSFLYTITQANTWEYKTVVIPGDTTAGGWNKDSSSGLRVNFNVGSGANYIRSPGSWGIAGDRGATGQVSLLATNGATWQLTGVQLEVGSAASPFEYRSYVAEVMNCKRYFEVGYTYQYGSVASSGSFNPDLAWFTQFQVDKRATPTITRISNIQDLRGTWTLGGYVSQYGFENYFDITNAGTPAGGAAFIWSANAEL